MKIKNIRTLLWAAALGAMFIAVAGQAANVSNPKVAYLGVMVAKVEDSLREQLKLEPGVGITIQEVQADSPAERVGLKQNDVLEKLDDQLLFNPEQFADLVRTHKSGDKVTLKFYRAGQSQSLEVSLGEQATPKSLPRPAGPNIFRWEQPFLYRPNPNRPMPFTPFEFRPFEPGFGLNKKSPMGASTVFLGVEIKPVDPTLASQLGLEEGQGVVVGHVVEGSPADKAELKEHDIILKLNQEIVKGPAGFTKRIQEMKKGQKISLELMRHGKTREVEAVLGERQSPETVQFDPLFRKYRLVPRIEVVPSPEQPGESIIRFWEAGKSGLKNKNVIIMVPPGNPGQPPAEREATLDDPSRWGHLRLLQDAWKAKTASIVVKSDQGVITIQTDNGNRVITVKDLRGKVLFTGPVNNDKQKAQLPANVRQRLDAIAIEAQPEESSPDAVEEIRLWNPEPPPV